MNRQRSVFQDFKLARERFVPRARIFAGKNFLVHNHVHKL